MECAAWLQKAVLARSGGVDVRAMSRNKKTVREGYSRTDSCLSIRYLAGYKADQPLVRISIVLTIRLESVTR